MIHITVLATLLFLLAGCAPKPQVLSQKLPQTYLLPSSYEALDGWKEEQYDALLVLFKEECETQKVQKLYEGLCDEAAGVQDARSFFQTAFVPFKITTQDVDDKGVMTGYYEPLLYGSKIMSERYRYPLYRVPDDLITVKLETLFPELQGRVLRGRLEGKTVVPYLAREQMDDINASVICWVDDRVDLFFLEVQGSGRILLDNNETIYVGYANQNGHPYRSIGKYLVETQMIAQEDISLQSIRQWLSEHPERIDEVLQINPSVIFFRQKEHAASGSLGLELTPQRSIAVDRRYIPLGAMLYMRSTDPVDDEPINRVVFAQDTGGAIKGEVRADFFWGFGEEAEERAGKMWEKLELWILLPRRFAQ